MSCGIGGENLVGLILVDVHNSEACFPAFSFFFHSSEIPEGGTAPKSWHGGNVNSFVLYPGISDRRKPESIYWKQLGLWLSPGVFCVCVLGMLRGFQRNFLSAAADGEIHCGAVAAVSET